MSRISFSEHIRPILGAVRTVPIAPKFPELAPPPDNAFLTISRQPGAGGWTLARQLVEALNAQHPEDRLWTCWDRELVEKVAADYQLAERQVESLEEADHSWLKDCLESLSFSDSHLADEATIYSRVARTIRALAESGRVVIVGRGGVFITRHMPGGIHIRLVAPFEQRVAFMAKSLNLSPKAAAAHVRQLEHNRQAFYRRYWPNEPLSPETFAITLNTALVPPESMLHMICDLVRAPVAAR